MVQTGPSPQVSRSGSKVNATNPSPQQLQLKAQRALARELEDEIYGLVKEIEVETQRKEKLDGVVSEVRTKLETESMKWRERYEYPSNSFTSLQEAVDKSAADSKVLEITADVTLESEPVVLCRPVRLLGRLVDSRRPVVQCSQLKIKGDEQTDIWITGLEIAGFPTDLKHLANTREMRTVGKKELEARDALSPGAKVARGVELRSRTAVLEVGGSIDFHISDCVISGEGRNGIEVGGKCDMRGSGLELTGGLTVGISVLDNAKVFLERAHIRNCQREGLHLSSAQSFAFELGSVEGCNDGFRILGDQSTTSNVTLGPEIVICRCARHGVRLNTGASATWAGGEILECNSGPVHLQQGCILSGWQEV